MTNLLRSFSIDSSNKMFYNAKEICSHNPELFKGIKTKIREIIERKKIPSAEYVFACFNMKLNCWNISNKDCSKAQLLINQSWVDTNMFNIRVALSPIGVPVSVPIVAPVSVPIVASVSLPIAAPAVNIKKNVNSEEEKKEETKEEKKEESKEEKKDSKKEEKKKESKPAPINPLLLASDLTTAQSSETEWAAILSLGISKSSLMGDKSYSLNTMIWSNLQQFAVSGGITKMNLDTKGKLTSINSYSLTSAYLTGNYMLLGGFTKIVPNPKYGV